MKKTILTTVLLATLTAVTAQESKQAEMGKAATEQAAKEYDAWATKLGLNAEQAQNAKVVLDRYDQQMKQLNSANVQGESGKARANILMEGRDRDLKTILTKEQFSAFLEQQKMASKEPKKAENNPMSPQSK